MSAKHIEIYKKLFLDRNQNGTFREFVAFAKGVHITLKMAGIR